jgi:hypothetical protein
VRFFPNSAQKTVTDMDKNFFQRNLPHFTAIAIFLVLAFFYMKPVLEGKQLLGHDTESWMAASKETLDYNEKNDDVALWTNSMFGGMPTYQISLVQPNNLLQYVEKALATIPTPVFFVVLYLIGFYILLLNFKINPWLAIAGSIAFTFASYNFIIIAAGHNSKAITIAYMAPLIGSVFQTFRNNKLSGGILTAFFLSLAIRANHIQILYYTLYILLVFGIVELVYAIRDKKAVSLLQSVGGLVAALAIALGMNATSLLTTNEYSHYTMRGASNGLTATAEAGQHGLSTDYITQWSYGIDETMTVLIPNFKGGASSLLLDDESETGKRMTESFGKANAQKVMNSTRFGLYWGTQPGTSGPVYFGAVVMLLFVLGFFVLDKRTLWWLVPVILLTLLLSWGRNFMALTEFFINYVPLYNKFRTVSMTLVATGFAVTLMAILTLKEILFSDGNKIRFKKPLIYSAAITGGIALVFALIPSLAGDFTAPQTDQYYIQQLSQAYQADMSFLAETLPADREAMLRADAFRSLLFVLGATALIWAFIHSKLKINLAIIAFGLLFLLDLMPVAKRYLNDDNFGRKRTTKNLIQPTEADKYILQDPSEFRVLNMSSNVFNDASTSYFHDHIGGYHAAKLRRYQELIERRITPELEKFYTIRTYEQLDSTLRTLGVLNMLNTKYIIMDPNSMPAQNPYANGNVWLPATIRKAANADEEMKLLGEINTLHEVVVDQQFDDLLPNTLQPDTASTIALTLRSPNRLTYSADIKTERVAVFSEIFYDKGWHVFVDGEEVPYFRANYLLRAVTLRPGKYTVEFRFEPSSYFTGNTIALISSIILLLLIAGFIVVRYTRLVKK